MKRFFRNIPWRNILIIGLVAVLGIGAVVGITSIAKNEKKEISSTVFKRGALNEQGFYVESDTSIYTKDLIECQGLEIEPDFETLGEYQVYYYDSNKLFMGKTDKINSQTDGVYVKGDNYRFAKYCRIVITPEVPKDEDGHVIDDYAIKFYEVAGIAAKYKISVNKDQKKIGEENLFESESTLHVKGFIPSYDANHQYKEIADSKYSYCTVFVTDIDSLAVNFEEPPMDLSYFVYNKSSLCLLEGRFDFENTDFKIELPEDSYMICIIYQESNVPAIYRAS